MAWEDTAASVLTGNVGVSEEKIAQGLSTGMSTLGMILFYMAIILGSIFLFYFFIYRNNIRAEIYKEHQGQLYSKTWDMAREIKIDGQRILSLFKSMKKTPLPDGKYRMKKGAKDLYLFREDDNGNLHPMEPDFINDKLKSVPQERIQWIIQDEREQAKKHEKRDDWLNKLQALAPTILFIFAFLIIYFISKHLSTNLNALTGAFGEVAKSCLGR